MKFVVLSVSLTLMLITAGPSSAAKNLPDFGLMLNDDGDLSFTSMDPHESALNVQAMVDSLAGTPVRTLMYSVGAGSDVLYYPTKVASVWGWRKTPYDDDPAWKSRIEKIKAGMRAGVDPIRVAGERAKRLGLFFVPSYRMNDDHFMADPYNYPLTGKFWIENGERFKIGISPIAANDDYGNLLDFSYEEVRRYRLGVIFEVIERYQDILDGVELDFNRVQVLFPPGKAREGAHLVTDMIRKVRVRLDQLGREKGRDYYLFVRVPPAPKNCHWAGLDIEDWMRKRLVDVLIPSQLMTLAHDMPIDKFVAIAKPAGCKVYPAIYPRTSYMWPFAASPSTESYSSAASRIASPDLIRGAASNYWYMGAAGFQLFNFNLPPDTQAYRIMRDLARPECLTQMSRIYAITPAYYLDYEDSYQYKKYIPVTLRTGRTCRLPLIVGVDLTDRTIEPPPDTCALRLGLRGAEPDLQMTVAVNGKLLHDGAAGENLVKVTGPAPASGGAHPDPPTSYLQLPIADLGIFRQGTNVLKITISKPEATEEVILVEAQLGVLHSHDYVL